MNRNGSQTAADAAALAAAREARDEVRVPFLAALKAGDIAALQNLLRGDGMNGAGACAAAADYASLNHASVQDGSCQRVDDPPGYSVSVTNDRSVGKSVVDGTENVHSTTHATAVVQSRCQVVGPAGDAVVFSCTGGSGEVRIDPTGGGFVLDLSVFYSVHLTG